MGVGNNTNIADDSDMQNPMGPSGSVGYTGGRRKSAGKSTTAGGPGVKEQHLTAARGTNVAAKKAFRMGSQDARMTDASPESPSALQLKTRRRGSGTAHIKPRATVE